LAFSLAQRYNDFMDRKSTAFVGLLVLAIIAAGVYVVLTGSKTGAPEATTQNSSQAEESEKAPNKPEVAAPTAGTYTPYSEKKVASTKGTKLLFFHAPWCPQCRAIEASINDGAIPAGVTVFKVDYDSTQALRQKYGVTLQTTFVKIDDQGEKIESYVAYETPHFDSVKKALLE
jgi:thiol-disulfide isomerase/thioredoxin